MAKEVTVRTKQELESAVESRCERIVIEGDLARKVKKGKKVRNLSTVALMAVAAAVATLPLTGGASAVAVAPVAATTGLRVAQLVAIGLVGLSLLLAVWKEYQEIECELGPGPRLVLRLKKKSTPAYRGSRRS